MKNTVAKVSHRAARTRDAAGNGDESLKFDDNPGGGDTTGMLEALILRIQGFKRTGRKEGQQKSSRTDQRKKPSFT